MAIKTYVTGSSTATIADNDVTVVGGTAGAEKVKILTGVTGVTADANIEKFDLAGSLADYKFVFVAGTGVQIQTAAGVVVTTIPSLNQAATLAFADGSAALTQTGSSAFALGSAAIPTTAAVLTTAAVATFDTTVKSTVNPLTGSTTPGQAFTLTTSATADLVIGTAGNDTVTGAAGTLSATDLILDATTTDNDTGTFVIGASIAPSISNIENVNLNFALSSGTLTASSISGAKAITLGSAEAGATSATVDGIRSGNTFVIDNAIKTVSLSTISTSDNAEVATVKLNGNTVSLTNVNTNDIDVLTINSTGAANTVTLADATDVFSATGEKIVITGDKSLTIKSAATSSTTGLGGATIENSLTSGATLTVQLTGAINDGTSINLSKVAANLFTFGTTNSGAAPNLTLASGSSLKLTSSLTYGGNATVLSSTDSGTLTLNPTVDQNTNTYILNLNKFATVNLNATDTVTIKDLRLGEAATLNPALLNITGTDASKTLTLAAVQSKVINASTYVGKSDITNALASASITGGTGNDTIKSGDVADVIINGGDGNDTLTSQLTSAIGITINGGNGDDSITSTVATSTSSWNGGAGDDTFTASSVANTIGNYVGGDGTDTLTLSLANTNDVKGQAFTLSGIEVIDVTAASTSTVTFSAAQLTGQSLNVITNSSGVIAVAAPAAASSIDLSGINHTTVASFTINGSTSGDVIKGTKAADVIIGGNGADTITGGAGVDIFSSAVTGATSVIATTALVASEVGAGDVITDFTSGTDKLQFTATMLNYMDGVTTSPGNAFAAAQALAAGQFKLFNATTALATGVSGGSSPARFIFNGVDGKLYLDYLGDTVATAVATPVITGATDDILLMTLTGVSTIAATDFVIIT